MSGITIPTLDEITGHTVMAKLRSLCKRFIGLAEEVDEKIDAPLEEAHLAVETANATLATAQESLEDAHDAMTTANSASATANEASESAQESAETVTGYDTRLTAVENRKLNITDINDYAVGLTGNQDNIAGIKGFVETIRGRVTNVLYSEYSGNLPVGKYRQFAKISAENPSTMIVIDVMVSANGSNYGFGRMLIGNPTTTSWFCKWVYRKSNAWLDATAIQIAREIATGNLIIFAKNPTITGLSVNLVYSKYSSNIQGNPRVEKVTNTTDYSLDGTDVGIESIIPGSDMA